MAHITQGVSTKMSTVKSELHISRASEEVTSPRRCLGCLGRSEREQSSAKRLCKNSLPSPHCIHSSSRNSRARASTSARSPAPRPTWHGAGLRMLRVSSNHFCPGKWRQTDWRLANKRQIWRWRRNGKRAHRHRHRSAAKVTQCEIARDRSAGH